MSAGIAGNLRLYINLPGLYWELDRLDIELITGTLQDRYDNDLVQFWSYVIAAVERLNPSFGEWVSPHLANLISEAYEPFIAALLNGFNSISGELALILDDFHVIELSSIHDSIAYMLEHLPAHIHLYMASRLVLVQEIAC